MSSNVRFLQVQDYECKLSFLKQKSESESTSIEFSLQNYQVPLLDFLDS